MVTISTKNGFHWVSFGSVSWQPVVVIVIDRWRKKWQKLGIRKMRRRKRRCVLYAKNPVIIHPPIAHWGWLFDVDDTKSTISWNQGQAVVDEKHSVDIIILSVVAGKEEDSNWKVLGLGACQWNQAYLGEWHVVVTSSMFFFRLSEDF